MRFEDSQLNVQYESVPQGRLIEPAPRAVRRPSARTTFALSRAIPDDPDYQKHVPLNYRLNAKAIVGKVAQDISQRGAKAHHVVAFLDIGIAAVEIFELITATSFGALALGLAAPLLGFAGPFLALGAPVAQAGQKIAAREAARGFARGVVMGADDRTARLLKEYFGYLAFPRYPEFPEAREVEMANYKMGLAVGYLEGRALTENQRRIFWRDLGHRITRLMGDQSYRGRQEQWQQREWVDWYIAAAATFRRDHLV